MRARIRAIVKKYELLIVAVVLGAVLGLMVGTIVHGLLRLVGNPSDLRVVIAIAELFCIPAMIFLISLGNAAKVGDRQLGISE